MPLLSEPSASRRAWALACHTRRRAGSPRHATIAGDRPPRYGEKNVPHTVGRGPVPRHATIAGYPVVRGPIRRRATIAGDRPPRYGARAPSVPRHAYHSPNLSNNESCMGLLVIFRGATISEPTKCSQNPPTQNPRDLECEEHSPNGHTAVLSGAPPENQEFRQLHDSNPDQERQK